MNLTRTLAGLGLAALLSVTAACGSDEADKKDGSAAKTPAAASTSTPEGTSALFLQATVDMDFTKVCELMADGETPVKSDETQLNECAEMFSMLMPADDEETKKAIAESQQALKDGPSKVTEVSPTSAQVSYASLNEETPTTLTKIGDEWLINLDQ